MCTSAIYITIYIKEDGTNSRQMGPNSRKHVVMVRSIKQKYERTSENYVNKHLSFLLVLHPDKNQTAL